jgi:hypothetical protein
VTSAAAVDVVGDVGSGSNSAESWSLEIPCYLYFHEETFAVEDFVAVVAAAVVVLLLVSAAAVVIAAVVVAVVGQVEMDDGNFGALEVTAEKYYDDASSEETHDASTYSVVWPEMN